MSAQFKSNVRIREEKGFGSISMKRLIFCGVGAVLVFMVLRLTSLTGMALPVLIGVFSGLLLLTGPRGGLPLWHRLLLGLRGSLVVAAAQHPHSIAAKIATALNIDATIAHLHHQQLFETQSDDFAKDVTEWAVYADLEEAEMTAGLRFITKQEKDHGKSL